MSSEYRDAYVRAVAQMRTMEDQNAKLARFARKGLTDVLVSGFDWDQDDMLREARRLRLTEECDTGGDVIAGWLRGGADE